MTIDQCNSCRHSATVSCKVGDCDYGNDVLEDVCLKEGDPRFPFDFTDETDCPCFEPREEPPAPPRVILEFEDHDSYEAFTWYAFEAIHGLKDWRDEE